MGGARLTFLVLKAPRCCFASLFLIYSKHSGAPKFLSQCTSGPGLWVCGYAPGAVKHSRNVVGKRVRRFILPRGGKGRKEASTVSHESCPVFRLGLSFAPPPFVTERLEQTNKQKKKPQKNSTISLRTSVTAGSFSIHRSKGVHRPSIPG